MNIENEIKLEEKSQINLPLVCYRLGEKIKRVGDQTSTYEETNINKSSSH